MKFLIPILCIAGIMLCGVITYQVLQLDFKLRNSQQNEKQLRKERDMYDSLYRKANTRLSNYQDSINKHCICK